MKNFLSALCFLLIFLGTSALNASARSKPLSGSTEIVVVTTADWNSPQGELRRFERINGSKSWKPAGGPVAVMVGKNGLGWGSGLLPTPADLAQNSAPKKKEGDGKAPAGVFRLSRAFGYAPQQQPGWKMPYLELTPAVECVDDSASKVYNQLVDRTGTSVDWKSSEQMRRADDLYRWGILVEHNSGPAAPGGGSCIFMHIWRGPGQPTVSCTAMTMADLENLLSWLDPARSPLLVQLPAAEYNRLRKRWNLPVIKPAATSGKSRQNEQTYKGQ